MCLPIDDTAMICWLRSQVRVLEAWREETASRPDLDIAQITQLERHYQWLTAEVASLETPHQQVA